MFLWNILCVSLLGAAINADDAVYRIIPNYSAEVKDAAVRKEAAEIQSAIKNILQKYGIQVEAETPVAKFTPSVKESPEIADKKLAEVVQKLDRLEEQQKKMGTAQLHPELNQMLQYLYKEATPSQKDGLFGEWVDTGANFAHDIIRHLRSIGKSLVGAK